MIQMIHYEEYVYIRYTFFRQITTFINIRIDFTKLFQLKGLKPKNKGQASFYECCDLTKKSISNVLILKVTVIEILGLHMMLCRDKYN